MPLRNAPLKLSRMQRSRPATLSNEETRSVLGIIAWRNRTCVGGCARVPGVLPKVADAPQNKRRWPYMKLLRCMAVLLLVAGCSNSSSTSDSNSSTVHAQSGFSNASVNGSYGWQFSGRIGTAGAVTASVLGTGTLVANGGVCNGGCSAT